MNTSILTASHYGVVHFGDLECEAVVLKGGERGYVRRQLAKLLGFHEGHKGGRFARFLTDFAPNSLSELEKTREPILLPSGLIHKMRGTFEKRQQMTAHKHAALI